MAIGNSKTCLVVRAGISGLLPARTLTEQGVLVTLLDKSRRAGGRMAARRVGEAVFDHGAQFFTARAGGASLPSDARAALEAIRYAPCIALMVQPKESRIPEPGSLPLPSKPISWIGDNRRKGILPCEAITIHVAWAMMLV